MLPFNDRLHLIKKCSHANCGLPNRLVHDLTKHAAHRFVSVKYPTMPTPRAMYYIYAKAKLAAHIDIALKQRHLTEEISLKHVDFDH